MSDFQTAEAPVEAAAPAPVQADFDTLGNEYQQLLDTPDDQFKVTKEQIKRYAEEHKTYRQRYGGYKQAFGDDAAAEDLQVLGAYYKALRTGDVDSIREYQASLNEVANHVIEQYSPAEQKAIKEEIKDIAAETGLTQAQVKAQLTPEDIQRIATEQALKTIEEREQKVREEQALQENIKKFQDTGKALADEFGVPAWGDPKSAMYDTLLRKTNEVFSAAGGNITIADAMSKAAVAYMEELQGFNAAQLAKKKQTAGAGARPTPKAGVEPAGQNRPKTMAEADAAFRRRLEAEAGR